MTNDGSELLSREVIYAGKIINLRVDTIALPSGRVTQREIVEHRGAVAIVPVNEGQEVFLVRQPRHATGEDLLEIPAGKLEEGENPEDCAARELREETGYVAAKMGFLFGCYSTPGFSDEFLRIYLATGLTYRGEAPDLDENITIVKMPLAEAIKLIWTGEIRDGKSIAALFAAELRLRGEHDGSL